MVGIAVHSRLPVVPGSRARLPSSSRVTSTLQACNFKTDLPAIGCQVASCGFLVIITDDLRYHTDCDVIRGGNVVDRIRVTDNGPQFRGEVYSDGYVEVTCDDDGSRARLPGTTGNREWTAIPTI